jgi:hypothetical protein
MGVLNVVLASGITLLLSCIAAVAGIAMESILFKVRSIFSRLRFIAFDVVTCVSCSGDVAQSIASQVSCIRLIELRDTSKACSSRFAIRSSSFEITSNFNRSVSSVVAMLLRALVVFVPCVLGAHVSQMIRQADCEQYGTYPAYTGPCETTSKSLVSSVGSNGTHKSLDCGAGRLNCLKQAPPMSGCTGYPAIGEHSSCT